MESNTVIVKDLSTLLRALDTSPRQKDKKETRDLNYALEPRDLRNIYRIFYPTTQNIHSIHQQMELSSR